MATRDADRSRASLLAAAEPLFAEDGFEPTTLDMIATKAGVSRGLPNYLFGSKGALYEAVLQSVISAREEFLAARVGVLAEKLDDALLMTEPPELLRAVVSGLYDAYQEFLISSPTYVRLMQREALSGGDRLFAVRRRLDVSGQKFAANDLLTALLARALGDDIPVDAPRHLLLTLSSLVLFSHEHETTLLRSLCFDRLDRSFEARRRELAIEMLLAGCRVFAKTTSPV